MWLTILQETLIRQKKSWDSGSGSLIGHTATYSNRNAEAGSTLAARRAGISAAMQAISVIAKDARAKVSESVGATPYTSPLRRREKPSAPGMPMSKATPT